MIWHPCYFVTNTPFSGIGDGTGDTFFKNRNNLLESDIILISPHREPDAALTSVAWHRVVADESHEKTQGGGLFSVLRWCVTGTPFTTSLTELHDQATFLGLRGKRLSLMHADGTTKEVASLVDLTCRCSRHTISAQEVSIVS